MKKRFKDYINKKAILKSGLFDEKYYLLTYPEVEKSNLDPLTHYLQIGAKEGKNPSKEFDTKYYLENNSDVKESCANPLLHYIQYGMKEGRKINSFGDKIRLKNKRSMVISIIKFFITPTKEGYENLKLILIPTFLQNIKNRKILQNINKEKKLILVFPIISWKFRWQRPQHILSRLAKKGYTVLYISNSFLVKNGNNRMGILSQLEENIIELHLSSEYVFNIYKSEFGEDLANDFSNQIKEVLKDIKIQPIYFIQFPRWYTLVNKLKIEIKGDIIFDCMDEHSGFTNISDSIIKLEEELVNNADLVISSSNKLYEKNKKINQNTIMIKNGTEYEYFSKDVHCDELKDLLDKPIVGYYGAISDWFDIDLIEYCAKMRTEYNFVLIGSTFGCNTENIKKLPNVYFLGEKNYKDLTKYLYRFDICTIPFKIIPLIEATNPVKFYEYISTGKPVVSTMLPELFEYQEICYLAKDKDEFLQQLDFSLKEKERGDYIELVTKRKQLAKENSWDERVNILYKEMKKYE